MANRGIGGAVSPRLLKVVIAVVVAVWIGTTAWDAINPNYDPPDTIGLAFMAILSALLGAAVASREAQAPPPEVRSRDHEEEAAIEDEGSDA